MNKHSVLKPIGYYYNKSKPKYEQHLFSLNVFCINKSNNKISGTIDRIL